jgi:hypothetical protein
VEPFDTYVREWPVISHAPLSAVTIIIASGAAGFGLGYFVFRERLETLRERLTQRDERIAELLTKPPAQAAIPPPNPLRPLAYGIPDMGLYNALERVGMSVWADQHHADDSAVEQELRDKVHMGALTAFGRLGPNSKLDSIKGADWEKLVLNPDSGDAEMGDGSVMYYDLQFVSRDVRALWPTPDSWMSR